MFEYYGWISLPLCLDGSAIDITYFDEVIQKASTITRIAEHKVINGHLVVVFAGLPNRRSQVAEEVIRFFRDVSSRYPDAYGVLYTRDSSQSGTLFELIEVGTIPI